MSVQDDTSIGKNNDDASVAKSETKSEMNSSVAMKGEEEERGEGEYEEEDEEEEEEDDDGEEDTEDDEEEEESDDEDPPPDPPPPNPYNAEYFEKKIHEKQPTKLL